MNALLRLSGEVAALTQSTKEKTAFLQELCMEMMAFIESEKVSAYKKRASHNKLNVHTYSKHLEWW